ncbi:thiamine diphosphokinase [Bacillus sp. DJP31]|uniref:thiamine diphosphokinase n=1 Tax=Bacillus sp. DJP31 TaxID=3409789 RepID=UPI003BB4BFB3
MIFHIMAGGPIEMLPEIAHYKSDPVSWIGVDRGLLTLLNLGITPVKGIGDFDSVTEAELKWVKRNYAHLDISPAEKDQTDTELAVNWCLAQKPNKIRIFGATGGRLDHALANMQLLMKGVSQEIVIEIIDRQNILTLLSPNTYNFEQHEEYPYVSFLPFSREVHGITLNGFKYPLTNRSIEWGTTLCVSNEIIEQMGTFSFSEGIVIMVKSKDLGAG